MVANPGFYDFRAQSPDGRIEIQRIKSSNRLDYGRLGRPKGGKVTPTPPFCWQRSSEGAPNKYVPSLHCMVAPSGRTTVDGDCCVTIDRAGASGAT